MSILIIGSDSFIGSTLALELTRFGKAVLSTTRRKESVNDSRIYLDLLEDISKWECPADADIAVICAGITKIEACRRDPISSARVNVEVISEFVEKLVARGVFVIYLSSDKVFDGSVAYRMADDRPCPVTEYGRQKAEAERRISQWEDSVAIVRLTKILGSVNSLFSKWVELLKKGEAIRPFSDMVMAPVSLSFAISVLRLVGEGRLSGIMQVSGAYDISYAEAAYRLAKLLDIDPRLVQPVKAAHSGVDPRSLSRYTTLNTDRIKSILRTGPPDVWQTVDSAFIQR